MSSPWLMAPFGHSGSQAPQLMHSSVIVVAIGLLLLGPGGREGTGEALSNARHGKSRRRRSAHGLSFPGDNRRAGPCSSRARKMGLRARSPERAADQPPVLLDLRGDPLRGADEGERERRCDEEEHA